jgi:hypothetical protein
LAPKKPQVASTFRSRHGSGKKVEQPLAMLFGQGMGLGSPKRLFVVGKLIAALDLGRLFTRLFQDEQEITVVGNQDAAVMLPVARHLAAVGRLWRVFRNRFHLHGAAQVARTSIEQSEIGPSRPGVGQFGRGLYGRVEPASHRVEEVFQRRAVGELGRAPLRGANFVETA